MANDSIIEKLDIDSPVIPKNAVETMQELQELIEQAEQRTERYDLSWVGKARAYAEAGMPINKTLRPDLEESVNFDETENLFITGDNLDALKLLQESYLGKVDMIYIDPPYNTGKDFVYHDKFSKTFEEAKEDSKDEEGNRQYTVNSRDNGRYHSDWLSMMYPRLRIARNLLSDSGVIFISIDDNEQANLKLLCDEVFGEENFVANMIRQEKAGAGHDSKEFAVEYDYILVYSKNRISLKINKERIDVENDTKYKLEDKFVRERGKYYLRDLDYKGSYSQSLDYPIKMPNGKIIFAGGVQGRPNTWRWSESKLLWGVENDFIVFKEDKVYIKQYQYVDNENNLRERFIPYRALTKFLNSEGTIELTDLGLNSIFSFPKSVNLIKYLIRIATNEMSLILDFFAGSGTTAHAVMKLNAEDGGNRKWILVQLNEPTAENSEARKAGYQTIDAIARERIRRAGKSLQSCHSELVSESPDLFQGIAGQARNDTQDFGFRALKIDSTNINDGIFKSPAEIQQVDLFSTVDNVKKERTPLDLLFGTLSAMALELNKELRVKNFELRIGGFQTLYIYDYIGELSGLVACFDDTISEDVIKEIARMKPNAAVFRDSSFATSADKVNLSEHFRTISPDTKVKVI